MTKAGKPTRLFFKEGRFAPIPGASLVGERSEATATLSNVEITSGTWNTLDAKGIISLYCIGGVPEGAGSFIPGEWILINEVRWCRYITNLEDAPHITEYVIQKGAMDQMWEARIRIAGFVSHNDFEYGQPVVLKIPDENGVWRKKFVGTLQGLEYAETYGSLDTILICYCNQYYLVNQNVPEEWRTNVNFTEPGNIEYPDGGTGIDEGDDDWIVMSLRRRLIDPSILIREWLGGTYRGKGTGIAGSTELIDATTDELYSWERITGICPMYILPVPGEYLIAERKHDFWRYTRNIPLGFTANTSKGDAIKYICSKYQYIFDTRTDLSLAIFDDKDPEIFNPDLPSHQDARILEDATIGFFIPYSRIDELIAPDPVTINYTDDFVLDVKSKPYDSKYYNRIIVECRDYNRLLFFKECMSRFMPGQTLIGSTSGATATIIESEIMMGSVGDANPSNAGRGFILLDTDLRGGFLANEVIISENPSSDPSQTITGAAVCVEPQIVWEALDTRYTYQYESPGVNAETEKASEYYAFLDGEQYTRDVAEDMAQTLYDYYRERVHTWTVTLRDRCDLSLYQKITFLGWDTIPASDMRIIRIVHTLAVEEDVPTVTVTIDLIKDHLFQKWLAVNARMQSDSISEIEAVIREYLAKYYPIGDYGIVTATQGNTVVVAGLENSQYIV